MFEKVRVPILGIVENMSLFVCPHCAETTPLFRHGGGRRAAAEVGIPFLGEVPLDAAVAEAGDEGLPVVARGGAPGPAARAFLDIARRLAQQVSIVNEATSGVRFHPEEVSVEGAEVVVCWSDRHVSRFAARELRGRCPCAACVDEVTGERRVGRADVAADVQANELRPVGHYAFQILWSDGHQTGIYSFDYLRELDPAAPAARPQPGPPQARPVAL
jgi:ATP-binding protein involved in chromosome partitioning